MNDEQTTQLLQDLVRIPSVNPHGDSGTVSANTGESQIVDYLSRFLRKMGLDVEFQDIATGRINLIGKFCSRRGRYALALAPHTDTVSVAGMKIDPFGANVTNGRLYGRGATDTKGPMTGIRAALANAIRQKSFREGDLDIYVCAVMGEERGNDGARALMEHGFKVDFAIAAEPTECRVVYTHKGALWFKLITRGRSSHGSMPESSASAILKMNNAIQYLLREYAGTLKDQSAMQLGSPTVNVGVIHGGTQINIVPDCCEIQVDRRTLPGENHAAIVAKISDALRHLPVEIEIIRDCRPLYTSPEHPVVRRLAEATGLGQGALAGASWFCDAGVFSEYEIPAVAFGPSSVTQAHTADEYIELAEVHRAAGILEKFLLSCARMDQPTCSS